MPRSMHLHTEIYPNLKIRNVHEKSRLFYISTRHSAVSVFTETIEFLERSLWDIAAAWLVIIFFLETIGSQKRIATYNFHII